MFCFVLTKCPPFSSGVPDNARLNFLFLFPWGLWEKYSKDNPFTTVVLGLIWPLQMVDTDFFLTETAILP